MRFPLSLSVLLMLAACADQTGTSAGVAVVTDTLAGGVIRVTSSGLPPLATRQSMHLQQTAVIDPDDDSPAMLTSPGSMSFDEAGNLFVATRRPAEIMVFDPEGNLLRRFGREGDGPGELLSGVGVLGVFGDTLLVHNPAGRLTWFSRDGDYLGEARSEAVGRWSVDPVIRDSQGRIWLEGMGIDPVARPPVTMPNGPPLHGPGWLRLDSQGRLLDSLGMPWDPNLPAPRKWTAQIRIGDDLASGATIIPYQPALSFSPRHDGSVVLGRNDGEVLRLSRNGSDTLRLIRLPLPRRAMTEAERRAELDKAVPAGSPFLQTARVGDMPDFWPRFTRLVVDPEDRIWLLVPGEGSPAAELWLIAADGALLARFPAPQGTISRAVWGRDRIAVPDEREDGKPIIRIYTLAG